MRRFNFLHLLEAHPAAASFLLWSLLGLLVIGVGLCIYVMRQVDARKLERKAQYELKARQRKRGRGGRKK